MEEHFYFLLLGAIVIAVGAILLGYALRSTTAQEMLTPLILGLALVISGIWCSYAWTLIKG